MSVVACVQMPLIIYAAGFLREAFPVDTKTNRHTLLHWIIFLSDNHTYSPHYRLINYQKRKFLFEIKIGLILASSISLILKQV